MSLDDGVQKRLDGEQETYQDDKKDGPYIILLGFFPPSTAFLCQAAKFKALKGPLFWQWTLSLGLTLFVCSVPVEAQDQCPCILGILLLYLYQEKDEIT